MHTKSSEPLEGEWAKQRRTFGLARRPQAPYQSPSIRQLVHQRFPLSPFHIYQAGRSIPFAVVQHDPNSGRWRFVLLLPREFCCRGSKSIPSSVLPSSARRETEMERQRDSHNGHSQPALDPTARPHSQPWQTPWPDHPTRSPTSSLPLRSFSLVIQMVQALEQPLAFSL